MADSESLLLLLVHGFPAPWDRHATSGVQCQACGSQFAALCHEAKKKTHEIDCTEPVVDLRKAVKGIRGGAPIGEILETAVGELDRTLTHLADRRPIVVGYSYGGLLAAAWAAAHVDALDCLRGLVIIGAPIRFPAGHYFVFPTDLSGPLKDPVAQTTGLSTKQLEANLSGRLYVVASAGDLVVPPQVSLLSDWSPDVRHSRVSESHLDLCASIPVAQKVLERAATWS